MGAVSLGEFSANDGKDSVNGTFSPGPAKSALEFCASRSEGLEAFQQSIDTPSRK